MARTVSKLPARAIKPRRSRYGVDISDAGKLARTYNGRCFSSLWERQYAELLDLQIGSGDVASVRYQVPYRLKGQSGKVVATYYADFVVTYPDGHTEVHETKGRETDTWRLKKRWLEADYPDVLVRVLFAPKPERRRRRK